MSDSLFFLVPFLTSIGLVKAYCVKRFKSDRRRLVKTAIVMLITYPILFFTLSIFFGPDLSVIEIFNNLSREPLKFIGLIALIAVIGLFDVRSKINEKTLKETPIISAKERVRMARERDS